MKKRPQNEEWEIFCDGWLYNMWAVRQVGDEDYNSPRLFHFHDKADAEAFKALLDKSCHAVRTDQSTPGQNESLPNAPAQR